MASPRRRSHMPPRWLPWPPQVWAVRACNSVPF
nr:MAG TPA: hypothetical protein [Caudoviricetes sp.]